jgi:hypothetical protein
MPAFALQRLAPQGYKDFVRRLESLALTRVVILVAQAHLQTRVFVASTTHERNQHELLLKWYSPWTSLS